MIQTSLRIALIVVLLIYLLCILRAVKRKNMRINYLIFWSIMGIVLIIALIAPNFIENASNFLGFGLPINMIFSIAIFIILYLIFDLTKLITKEQNKNVILTQEISLLKKRVEELEKKEAKKPEEK